MFSSRILTPLCARLVLKYPRTNSGLRTLATQAASVSFAKRTHKVVVVGGGAAGLSVSHKLLRSGKFAQDDIAIVDPATWHDFQPGWTLVGGGLKKKADLRKPLGSLIHAKMRHYKQRVEEFLPSDNFIRLADGEKVHYEHLIVVPGIDVNFNSIKGLSRMLADPDTPVSSIYSYDTCDKVYKSINNFKHGTAIFTQPSGTVKCAGAPQKIMWLALDRWKRAGLYTPSSIDESPINVHFATALPSMFGVPKYSVELEKLRKSRKVMGHFQHDLVSIDGTMATFARTEEKDQVTKQFDFLHVVPKMGPHAFVKESTLADKGGFVEVDENTTRHVRFSNVWSVGDASSLPTSKTMAAITSQVPILVHNLLRVMEGKDPEAKYDGYSSCPLLTEYGKVMLAEFKYGGEDAETFGRWFGIDQAIPRRIFYYIKKDFFPWVYYKSLVKGTWAGPNGWTR